MLPPGASAGWNVSIGVVAPVVGSTRVIAQRNGGCHDVQLVMYAPRGPATMVSCCWSWAASGSIGSGVDHWRDPDARSHRSIRRWVVPSWSPLGCISSTTRSTAAPWSRNVTSRT